VRAALGGGIPARVITEFREQPRGQQRPQAGLGQVDPGGEVAAKGHARLLLEDRDLLVEHGDHLSRSGAGT
jgi:hypothetical protein